MHTIRDCRGIVIRFERKLQCEFLIFEQCPYWLHNRHLYPGGRAGVVRHPEICFSFHIDLRQPCLNTPIAGHTNYMLCCVVNMFPTCQHGCSPEWQSMKYLENIDCTWRCTKTTPICQYVRGTVLTLVFLRLLFRRFILFSSVLRSDVGFVDFRDPESATIAKDRFKGHELRGHIIGAYDLAYVACTAMLSCCPKHDDVSSCSLRAKFLLEWTIFFIGYWHGTLIVSLSLPTSLPYSRRLPLLGSQTSGLPTEVFSIIVISARSTMGQG